MALEIKVPDMGESITEATVIGIRYQAGDAFKAGAVLLELETDKITQEIYAPADGTITELPVNEGATVKIGDVLLVIAEGEAVEQTKQKSDGAVIEKIEKSGDAAGITTTGTPTDREPLPAARRMIAEQQLDAGAIPGSGRGNQVTKSDVVDYLESSGHSRSPAASASTPSLPGDTERIVPMSRLRLRIAERLVEVQQTAAILTTFNEIDMQAVMTMRGRYKEAFKEKHGVGLGFMSFFISAVLEALREFPALNAEIRGTDIVYRDVYNIGVAVGGPRGLVVPVIRNAEGLTFAGIEKEIARLAERVRDNKIEIAELSGGTFTVSNGGVYGSMLSTPILNPPQSGILGMHNIVKRPVVIDDQIVVRPVMYVALSYDHRIVDGREAVSSLVRVKQLIENPERLLLEI